jgi:hypothetical protein
VGPRGTLQNTSERSSFSLPAADFWRQYREHHLPWTGSLRTSFDFDCICSRHHIVPASRTPQQQKLRQGIRLGRCFGLNVVITLPSDLVYAGQLISFFGSRPICDEREIVRRCRVNQARDKIRSAYVEAKPEARQHAPFSLPTSRLQHKECFLAIADCMPLRRSVRSRLQRRSRSLSSGAARGIASFSQFPRPHFQPMKQSLRCQSALHDPGAKLCRRSPQGPWFSRGRVLDERVSKQMDVGQHSCGE